MKTYLRFSILLLAFALFGCDGGSQVVGPDSSIAFNKDKPSKKCASCGYVIDRNGGAGWATLILVDSTTTPPDTISKTFLDLGVVESFARLYDALYVTTNYYDLFVIDLSDPRHPAVTWAPDYIITGQFNGVRVSGSNLYAGWFICDVYDVCTGGIAKWNISDPFNPRLIGLKQYK
jgi:hypothetical protein